MNPDRAGLTERVTSVEDALAAILGSVSRRPAEDVPLAEAAGRVLAEAITAAEDLWPFPRAAMDGVAVRAADLAGASDGAPVALRVVGAIYSGETWDTPLEPNTAVRIATGAPIPRGADAVVPQELLAWHGDDALIRASIPHGRHIFPAGEDARAGEVVLEAGTVLRGGDLGLLAALGRSRVPVVQKALVAILACGDELIALADPLRPGQVRESNSYVLAAEAAALGATPRLLGVARDDAAALEQKIRDGLQADVLLVCGGVSVGDRDFVKQALLRGGVTLKFVGVAMKPGAPTAFGLAAARPVFALPGTPGAARIAFELLVRPALRAILGHRQLHRPAVPARLGRSLKVTPGRRRYLWGRATLSASGVQVVPLTGQGTATLRSASDANALIVIQPEDAHLPPGSLVTVQLLTAEGLPTAREGYGRALAVVGAHGAGKTALIERLIPQLRRRDITVAVVKHHAHLDLAEAAQTDTARSTQAGAVETVLAGPGGAVHRYGPGGDPPLDQVLARVGPAELVLVEGYSQSTLPKILVRTGGVETDRQAPTGPIFAVVGDAAPSEALPDDATQHYGWDDIEALTDLIARWFVSR